MKKPILDQISEKKKNISLSGARTHESITPSGQK